MISPVVRRTYLVQADRDAARDVAIDLATRSNSRVRVARGGRVSPARAAGWWSVVLRLREERR